MSIFSRVKGFYPLLISTVKVTTILVDETIKFSKLIHALDMRLLVLEARISVLEDWKEKKIEQEKDIGNES